MPPPREDEQSIKARGSQLYQANGFVAGPDPLPLEGRRRKSFAAYLAEAPAMRLAPFTKLVLGAVGLVVVGLFGASLTTLVDLGAPGTASSPRPGAAPVLRWSDADIGSPGQAGSARDSGGTWTVNGGGGDIWEASDQFHLVSVDAAGDTSISARVTGLTNTNPWAKAGVMFRESTAPNARFISMVVTAGQGVAFQWRSAPGGGCLDAEVPGIAVPVWVKIVRAGNNFQGSFSTDGAKWIPVGTPQEIALNPAGLVGLAVTAHDNGKLATATFEGVMVSR